MPKRVNVNAVYKALRKKFGAGGSLSKKDPLDHIMFSVLLTRSPQDKAEKAFSAIKANYVDWNEVRVTSLTELSRLLKTKGCRSRSAEPMVAFLQKLYLDNHYVSVSSVKEMVPKKARDYLTQTAQLPPDAVAEILLDAFDMSSAPIHNEIKRVLVRLGLVGINPSQQQAQKAFMRIAANGKMSTAHRLLHILARDYCQANEPKSSHCPVKKHCPFGQQRIKKAQEIEEKAKARKAKAKPKTGKPARRAKLIKKKK